MERLLGACQSSFLQGLALGAASAAALSPPALAAASARLARGSWCWSEPAPRVSQTHGDVMALEHLCYSRATRSLVQMN